MFVTGIILDCAYPVGIKYTKCNEIFNSYGIKKHLIKHCYKYFIPNGISRITANLNL